MNNNERKAARFVRERENVLTGSGTLGGIP
jgi:hypothetical protein